MLGNYRDRVKKKKEGQGKKKKIQKKTEIKLIKEINKSVEE